MARAERHIWMATLCVGAIASGCVRKSDPSPPAAERFVEAGWSQIGAKVMDVNGKDVGRVAFKEGRDGVFMRILVNELTPGWHAIHFHVVGDCSDASEGFKRAGAHFNPDERQHGLAHEGGPERGDLPNIHANSEGRAVAEIFKSGVSLHPSEAGAAQHGPFPLLDDDGFAVIVHAQPDDHTTQPIGGAGDRVSCAALGGSQLAP
jgi:Cu-Zn family superoxide dismutase